MIINAIAIALVVIIIIVYLIRIRQGIAKGFSKSSGGEE